MHPNLKNFNGKVIKEIKIGDSEITKQSVVVYFTDDTKMTIEVKAKGNGWDFEELIVDIY